MRVALFADIHGNRQAFEACLADARAQGAESFVLLGDYVGYGADPGWTTNKVMELAASGAVALRGNHDTAVSDLQETMNDDAAFVIEWTRRQLDPGQRDFLANLPLANDAHGCLFVHAEASRPGEWIYVTDAARAATSMNATSAGITICGHVHRPTLYSLSSTAKMTTFVPTSGVPVPLLAGRQWLAVLGSVGQPRDGNPAAAWGLLDTARRELTFCRTPYDVEAAARAIRDHALPDRFAARLLAGR